MQSASVTTAIFISLLAILAGFTYGAEVESGEEPPVNRIFYARLGDREYLPPHLSGLRELAVAYLPQSLKLVNIVEAYREITNSIQYELIMATVDSANNEIVCRIVVKKRPWMQFQLEQRGRRPEHTNCSSYYDGEAIDETNAKDATPQPSGHADRWEADVGNVESQIVPQPRPPEQPHSDYSEKGNPGENSDKTLNNLDRISDSDEKTEKPNDLTDKNKSFLDDFFNVDMQGEKRDIRDSTTSDQGEYIHAEIRRKRELHPQHSDDSDESLEDQTDEDLRQKETARRHFEYFLKEIVREIPFGDDNYRIDSVIKPKFRMNALVIFKGKMKVKNGDGEEKQCSVYMEKIKDDYGELSVTCPHQGQKRIPLDQYNKLKNVIFGSPKLLYYTQYLFKKYQKVYDKQYSLEEYSKRYEIFRENVFKIELLKNTEQGTGKYGITEFADMTEEEYRLRTGLLYRSSENAIGNPLATIPDGQVPDEFDWRKKGAVSPVKDQGGCGSCWAFSVTGNIEGLHAVQTGQLEEYSEQELLDCDTIDNACKGGMPDDAYKAIEQIGGLELENEYPYKAQQQKCRYDPNLAHVKIHGAVDLPKNETAIALWLKENGPISIGVNANAMQFYRGGISHPWRWLCRHGSLDHGVLIVGFGVANYPVFNKTMPYWIIKNSWGKSWGEQGYYRIFRGDNSCGVSEMATSAVLA